MGLRFLAPNPFPWSWRLPGRTGLPGNWGSSPSASISPSIVGSLPYICIVGTMPTRSPLSPWSWSRSMAPVRKRLSFLLIFHLCLCAAFGWTSLLPPDSYRSLASIPIPRASCFGPPLRLSGSPLCHVLQTTAMNWCKASYCHANCCRRGSPQGCQLWEG